MSDNAGIEKPKSKKVFIKKFFNSFSTIGAILLVLSAVSGYNTYNFLKQAKPIPAKVIRLERETSKHDSKNVTSFRPVFEYTDLENNKVEYKSKVSSSLPYFSLGQEATLLVTDDYSKIVEDKWFAKFGLELILSILGLIFLKFSKNKNIKYSKTIVYKS